MFCVLSGCRRTSGSTKDQLGHRKHSFYLLPDNQIEKYDSYISAYSELLYGWGLLTKRAELNKHRLTPMQDFYGDVCIPASTSAVAHPTGLDKNSMQSGIAIICTCARCGQDTVANSNWCTTCRDFALRCAICDNAVRGLFSVCDICKHGGHVLHLQEWFSKHSECPTGCGCICAHNTLMTEMRVIESTPLEVSAD